MPADTPIERLVYLAKPRRPIERDYLELKQELGLGHYDGRGFHHHAARCIAAFGFVVADRAPIVPSGPGGGRLVEAPPLPAQRHLYRKENRRHRNGVVDNSPWRVPAHIHWAATPARCSRNSMVDPKPTSASEPEMSACTPKRAKLGQSFYDRS